MKLALFKDMGYGHEIVFDETQEQYVSNSVRISDYVDVDFPPLSGDEQIVGQVRKLDEMRSKEVAEHVRKLAAIDERKAKLLALPAPPPDDDLPR